MAAPRNNMVISDFEQKIINNIYILLHIEFDENSNAIVLCIDSSYIAIERCMYNIVVIFHVNIEYMLKQVETLKIDVNKLKCQKLDLLRHHVVKYTSPEGVH